MVMISHTPAAVAATCQATRELQSSLVIRHLLEWTGNTQTHVQRYADTHGQRYTDGG